MTQATAERIAQFEKMAHDDPDNDMAHYSLGNAYLEAGRASDAAVSFQRCIAINPGMSKAYQLAGQALIKAGRKEEAGKLLTTGYTVAAQRGDRLPQAAMTDLLKSIGLSPPATGAAQPSAAASPTGGFVCRRTGKPGTKMDRPPMRGKLGQWIYENISAETWRTWIGQGTKVINELRLDFSRDQDQETYDRYMREFLGIDDALHQEIMSGAPA